MTASIIPKPKPTALPRRWVVQKLWHELLGMSPPQANLAQRLSYRKRERHEQTCAALLRVFDASETFEAALEDYREQMLVNLETTCPKAAAWARFHSA